MNKKTKVINRRWLVFANSNRCDHVRSFTDKGFISWLQSVKFKVGDTVYVYISKEKRVRYKAIVKAIGKQREDSAYWFESGHANDITARLKLVCEYQKNDNKLNDVELVKHNFHGGSSIQRPICNNNVLLDYIEKCF